MYGNQTYCFMVSKVTNDNTAQRMKLKWMYMSSLWAKENFC